VNAPKKSCPFCGAAGGDLKMLADLEGFGAGSAVVCDCCGAIGPSHVDEGAALALWNGAALTSLGLTGQKGLNNQAGGVRSC